MSKNSKLWFFFFCFQYIVSSKMWWYYTFSCLNQDPYSPTRRIFVTKKSIFFGKYLGRCLHRDLASSHAMRNKEKPIRVAERRRQSARCLHSKGHFCPRKNAPCSAKVYCPASPGRMRPACPSTFFIILRLRPARNPIKLAFCTELCRNCTYPRQFAVVPSQ